MEARSTPDLRDLYANLTRDFDWVFARKGGVFKIQTAPPIGRQQRKCLEFWITRIDLPDYAQVAYHVYEDEQKFDETIVSEVLEILMEVEFPVCKECRSTAIGKGPCKTNHEGICEMCHIADPQNLYSKSYDKLVEEARSELSSVQEAYAKGRRFTLLIKGLTHIDCPESCQGCRDGFGNVEGYARYLEVAHHFNRYPVQRAIDKEFTKHVFYSSSEIEVIDTRHWIKDREDKLKNIEALRNDFERAKKAHAGVMNQSAVSDQLALSSYSFAAQSAGKGPRGAQGPTP
ncbi:hypothetical protein [Limnohabitans sp.]|uniref:hypothetical protein n=1 Tax=Limnohabitans sp. TaxID=1907725 RepID=UPI00262C9B82|nr:hypothetical protein [Limnohabitans sp.]